MLTLEPVPDDPRPWDQIPGVEIIGIILGLTILVAVIRYLVTGKWK